MTHGREEVALRLRGRFCIDLCLLQFSHSRFVRGDVGHEEIDLLSSFELTGNEFYLGREGAAVGTASLDLPGRQQRLESSGNRAR